MSVVALPRHDVRRDRAATTTQTRTHRRARRLTTATKLWSIAGATAMIVLAGNAYVAQRQVELHQEQTALLQDQAHYASRVSQLTKLAAPELVEQEAGRLHLVEPVNVQQIGEVGLNVVLPPAHVLGSYRLRSRVQR